MTSRAVPDAAEPATTRATDIRLLGVGGIPEVRPGDDVTAVVGDAIAVAGAEFPNKLKRVKMLTSDKACDVDCLLQEGDGLPCKCGPK